ncbi:MAG TPA: response regulator transcription factor [Rhizomicrobium sp.]|nr:response regulator transcription factor [Rhizomicrobium sp.]
MLENMEVAIVGANGLFRSGIASLLSGSAKRVHELGDPAALQRLLESGTRIGLVLIEAAGFNGDTAEHIARLRELAPRAQIAVLSGEADSGRIAASFAAGADGFLLKDISAGTLIQSLRMLALGEKVFPIAEFFSSGAPEAQSELSAREREILRCLIEGDSNKRIANRLGITEATVKVHLKSILRKTRTANRTQAAIWALRSGMRKEDVKSESSRADLRAARH